MTETIYEKYAPFSFKVVREKVKDESTYIIKDGLVHMAHMDIHFTHSTNGVAALHTEILKESKPYKSYISFPDGHGNMALIFTRIRKNKTLQFLAVVINARYGILDAFGFNSMTERDFYRIVDKFYNYQEKYEIKPYESVGNINFGEERDSARISPALNLQIPRPLKVLPQ